MLRADDGPALRDRLRIRRHVRRFNGPAITIASSTVATVMATPMASVMVSMVGWPIDPKRILLRYCPGHNRGIAQGGAPYQSGRLAVIPVAARSSSPLPQ